LKARIEKERAAGLGNMRQPDLSPAKMKEILKEEKAGGPKERKDEAVVSS
jgi:hypothetical protein